MWRGDQRRFRRSWPRPSAWDRPPAWEPWTASPERKPRHPRRQSGTPTSRRFGPSSHCTVERCLPSCPATRATLRLTRAIASIRAHLSRRISLATLKASTGRSHCCLTGNHCHSVATSSGDPPAPIREVASSTLNNLPPKYGEYILQHALASLMQCHQLEGLAHGNL